MYLREVANGYIYPLLARTTEILLPPGLQLYWILSENRFEKEPLFRRPNVVRVMH